MSRAFRSPGKAFCQPGRIAVCSSSALYDQNMFHPVPSSLCRLVSGSFPPDFLWKAGYDPIIYHVPEGGYKMKKIFCILTAAASLYREAILPPPDCVWLLTQSYQPYPCHKLPSPKTASGPPWEDQSQRHCTGTGSHRKRRRSSVPLQKRIRWGKGYLVWDIRYYTIEWYASTAKSAMVILYARTLPTVKL